MRVLAGQTVLITGASGGIGSYIVQALARRKLNLAMVAFPGAGLEEVAEQAEAAGSRTLVMAADLRSSQERRRTVETVQQQFGAVHLLINNAGVEFTSPFHELSEEQISEVLTVNLEAAMMMSRLVIPGMLAQKRGHIVQMASLAGRAGPAFQECYSASKAGLIAFTYSLRASYRGSGVSASAVVPGFVEAGIYAHLKETSGCSAPRLLGTSHPTRVADALIRAVEENLPEVIINPIPVRPLFAVSILAPRLGEWAMEKAGGHDFFRKVFRCRKERQLHAEAQKL